MTRVSTIPAQTVNEDIRSVAEYPPSPGTPGIVQTQVGVKDADGAWTMPQTYVNYVIEGADYDELVGPPQAWNPNKPAGTYHNDDLWYFIDKLRAASAPKEVQS